MLALNLFERSVAASLEARGWQVYRPVRPGGADLLARHAGTGKTVRLRVLGSWTEGGDDGQYYGRFTFQPQDARELMETTDFHVFVWPRDERDDGARTPFDQALVVPTDELVRRIDGAGWPVEMWFTRTPGGAILDISPSRVAGLDDYSEFHENWDQLDPLLSLAA
jgi:hypothetical protein